MDSSKLNGSGHEKQSTAAYSLPFYGFRAETHENDLALINVAPPFKLEDRVLVAKLPNRVFKNRNRKPETL